MEHPPRVLYLEHDGKVLLVDSEGNGPKKPVMNNVGSTKFRFPTKLEAHELGIEWEVKNTFDILGFEVIKAHPDIEWPENWAWKDECISDDEVHPIARESIYRSIHRLVSKVMVLNTQGQVLMGKIERGHFVGHWTLPGGYMDHDEHPAVGCVRETLEEMGIEIELDDEAPIITQRIFTNEGISFVSFTYQANWGGDNSEIKLKENEISEFAWLSPSEALSRAVSGFDAAALRHL
ncbi:MAG: NUDIX hydrolase [Candidatus Poseidoniaceae archaeon]